MFEFLEITGQMWMIVEGKNKYVLHRLLQLSGVRIHAWELIPGSKDFQPISLHYFS